MFMAFFLAFLWLIWVLLSWILSGFDVNKVAYSGNTKFDPSLTPMEIVSGNLVWVGGAMFMARPEVMYIYTQDYMRAVRKLLDMKVMSTDQQVSEYIS